MTSEETQREEPAPTGLEHLRFIAARLAELEVELTRLRAQWNGTATEAYQAAQEQWRAALRDLNALLTPRPQEEPPASSRAQPAEAPVQKPRRSSPRWA
ncbi:hypothetical protein EHW97_02100 [Aeromicrobium camelliae]|uniref:WXG100 family type VII secretion target n=1 Tax=Aeromicrobium camelliae TaxID=1538144 RepID=A0A3N6WXA9_9ACTN|nr:WXG100 family type VII secretion target [Aeromicrobium camelliae]RQN09662.1 hypothetical protein EHW97_02100 [Aeromicrobium camelliae]